MPKARQALTRVFRICDRDKDELLNDTELHTFNYTVFNQALAEAELQDVKRVRWRGGGVGVSRLNGAVPR